MLRLVDLSVSSLHRESTDSDYCQCLKVVFELVCSLYNGPRLLGVPSLRLHMRESHMMRLPSSLALGR